MGQVIPPRSKVRSDFCSQKSKSGLVKGFVSIVGPVPPYGRGRPKDGIMGLLYSSDRYSWGFSQNVEGKLRQNEIFSNRSKRSKGKFFAYLAFLPYPN